MHRHGYKGRKLSRERDQRRALWRGLAVSLIENGQIETTLPKAKDLAPKVEKIITKAKTGGLANRRLVEARLGSRSATVLLFDTIAPQLKDRQSGFLRIARTDVRVGDGAQLAVVEFVDELNFETEVAKTDKPVDEPTQAPATPAKTKEDK